MSGAWEPEYVDPPDKQGWYAIRRWLGSFYHETIVFVARGHDGEMFVGHNRIPWDKCKVVEFKEINPTDFISLEYELPPRLQEGR